MGLIAKIEKRKKELAKESNVEKSSFEIKSTSNVIQAKISPISNKIKSEVKIDSLHNKIDTAIDKWQKNLSNSNIPEVEEPKVEEPKVEEPKVEEPKVEEPKVEEPKVEEPKVEEPKVEEPKVEDPKIKSSGVIDFVSLKKSIEKDFDNNNHTTKKINIKSSLTFDRVNTGILGLDEVMQGGVRKGTINLVGGGSGSGKSIFATQFILKGIEDFDEPGVYVSFEENIDKFSQDYEQFGWEIKKYIQQEKLAFFYFSPEQVNKFVESGGGAIRDKIEKMGAKRLVIDSLTAFSLLFESDLERRRGLLKLFDALQNWGVTAFMIAEQEPDPDRHVSTILEFQVDGVILLYNIRKGDVRERSLEIFKMRATKHSAKIFPMEIGNQGILIYPEETVF